MAKYIEFDKTMLVFGNYQNPKNNALSIVNPTEGPLAKASVNINEQLKDNEVAIKTWSENIGIIDDLMAMGVISEPKRWIDTGRVSIAICNILDWCDGN